MKINHLAITQMVQPLPKGMVQLTNQQTGWNVMAALTTLGITSPLYMKQQAMYCPR